MRKGRGRGLLAGLLPRIRLAPSTRPVNDDGAPTKDLYAPRSNWSSFTGRKLNISGFLFRDIGRTGSYDIGDRPLETVAVRMTAPQGQSVIRWTNSNGFANFSMSAKRDADITEGGSYQFDVIVPDGWIVTTANESQIKQLEVFPGAVADIVATPPFFPVGLAPELSITGTAPQSGGAVELFVTSPAGDRDRAELDGNGGFLIPAAAGRWKLEFVDSSLPKPSLRVVEVKDVPVRISGHRVEESKPVSKKVSVVDFESVTPKNIKEMPNGTGGLNWWNFVALAVAPGYTNNAVSGNYVCYNSSGHPGQISSPKPFDFVGGYFGVAWKRAHGEGLVLKGWKDEKLKYEDRFTLSYLGPVWFDAEYRDIDRLDIATDHYWQVVMDDLAFRLPS